ncbi:ATP-dependent DNA helicase II subunit 1 [Pseudogymnoascus australis]
MADSKEDWKRKDEGDEEEDDEVDETDYKSQKDAILFAIEVSPSMLTPPPASDSKKADTDSPAAAALKCAYQIMQQRIISNPKDMIGILLFGTAESKGPEGNATSGIAYPHIYLLTDLDVPAACDVKALKELVEDEDAAKEVLVPAPEGAEVTMSNVLFCANQIFTTRAPSFGSRRLFVITDRDDPHESDKGMRAAAAVRAKDLYDLGVGIELFPIERGEGVFDRSKFYDDVIYSDPADTDTPATTASTTSSAAGADGISLLNSLISNINSKQTPKRALFSNLPFEIGPGLTISVKGYNILQRQKPARSCYVWLSEETAQIATGETTQLAADTTRTVQKAEVKKAYKFGGEQVLFTKDEQKELKNFGPPGLRIVGFKPQALLPTYASVNKSTFLYPSEEDYVGSTRVFAALWQKLLDSSTMGIAWYIPRANANPQYIALLPSRERLDPVTSQQIMPAGLWAYPLPTADDLRVPAPGPAPIVSPDALTDKMHIVVQQLQLPGAVYEPSRYPNPALQWHYRILQAMALEEEVPELGPGDDKTLPRARQIDKRAGPYVVDWGRELEEGWMDWVEGKGESVEIGVKRSGEGKAEGKVKRVKENGLDEVERLAKEGKAGTATVVMLKDFLAARGLNVGGKKAELVERVEEALEKK